MLKVLINQRVGAHFRKPFFDSLSEHFSLTVASGKSRIGESIKTYELDNNSFVNADIKYYLKGAFYFDLTWKENILQINPDVVVITPTPRMLSNYLVLFFCKKRGIPVVGWGMGEMPGHSKIKHFIHRTLATTLVSKLQRMICYSKKAKIYYESCGLNKSLVTVSPNAIDTKKSNLHFEKLVSNPNALDFYKNKFNIDRKKVRFLFIGRLTKSKKVQELITSFLDMDIDNAELCIVGDGIYRNELESLAGKSKSIRFLGYQDGECLAAICMLSDLFILPSLGGLAINQAMIYSLPVIASEGDGTELDLITPGYNGFLFEPNNYDMMKKCILEALNSKALRDFGANSRERVLTSFSIENMVDEFRAAIESAHE